MFIKNSEIESSISSINRILSTPIPFRAKLTISRNKKALVEVEEVLKSSKDDLIEKFAQRDDNGNIIRPLDENGNPNLNRVNIQKDKVEEFHKELLVLNDQESEVDVNKVDVDESFEKALTSLYDFDPTPVLWMFND